LKKLSEIGDTRFALASILPTKPGTAILILLSACLSDGGSETTPTDPSQGQAPTNSAPTISTYIVENLLPDTYYVVATAINASGIERRYSDEAVKTVNAM
jgi:hypothetical protein